MNEQILVLETNKEILRNLHLMLKFNGFNVLRAEDGTKAFEFLQNAQDLPALIICDLDYCLHRGDFYERLKQNKRWSEIPYFFLSSNTSEEKALIERFAIDDYLIKPFKEQTLLKTVYKKLDKKLLMQKPDQ